MVKTIEDLIMICLHIIFILIVVILLLPDRVISIDLKLKNIKEKTKNLLHESLNKTRGMSQVGPKPGSYLDYPGLSIDKLRTIKRLWDLYYKCMENLQQSIHTNTFQAKIITAFRSSSIRYLIIINSKNSILQT